MYLVQTAFGGKSKLAAKYLLVEQHVDEAIISKRTMSAPPRVTRPSLLAPKVKNDFFPKGHLCVRGAICLPIVSLSFA